MMMMIFWLLAVVLPLVMGTGLVMMTGQVRMSIMTHNRQERLGIWITEMSALMALAAFLIGLILALN